MNCVYCITSSNFLNNGEQNIDMVFAKRGIEDYFNQTRYPYLRFVALGEPTQDFDGLQELHSFAKDISNGKAKFELQTNGVFSEIQAQWIAEHIDTVWLSFDGLTDVHDQLKRTKNDTPTSDIILRNLSILQAKTFAGLRATITTLNVTRQCEMVQFAHDHGVKALFSKVILPPATPALHHTFHTVAQSLNVDMMEYARHFVDAWKLSRTVGVFYGNGYINNFDEACEYACRACVPCPHLTPDGYVSACDRATYGKTPLQEYIYGKYDPVGKKITYDETKINMLRSRSIHNMHFCQDCKIKYRCAGGCLGTVSQLEGNMFNIIPDYCEAFKYMYDHIDWDPREGLFPYFMT